MNALQLELTKLIWKDVVGYIPTITDFHICVFSKDHFHIEQWNDEIYIKRTYKIICQFPYNSLKELINQSDETLQQIINFIKNNINQQIWMNSNLN